MAFAYCRVVLIVLLATFVFEGGATENEPVWVNEFQQLVTMYNKNKGFTGSVAVLLDEEPIRTFSAGMRNQTMAVTPDDLFSSGSVGKEFTTVAILRLHKEQALSLDDNISRFLPHLPGWAKMVTVRHLLNHTSGLPKISWIKDISTEDVMAQVMALSEPAFPPGSDYLYGNINVMLRAEIVESVTGMSFADYLKRNLLNPSQMTRTQHRTLNQDDSAVMPGDYPTNINGVSLYTTPSDLVRWERSLLSGRALSGIPITQWISKHPSSGKDNHCEFDFGHFLEDSGNIAVIQHDGSNPSHHVLKYSNLRHGLTFIAMSNDGKKSTLYELKDDLLNMLDN